MSKNEEETLLLYFLSIVRKKTSLLEGTENFQENINFLTLLEKIKKNYNINDGVWKRNEEERKGKTIEQIILNINL